MSCCTTSTAPTPPRTPPRTPGLAAPTAALPPVALRSSCTGVISASGTAHGTAAQGDPEHSKPNLGRRCVQQSLAMSSDGAAGSGNVILAACSRPARAQGKAHPSAVGQHVKAGSDVSTWHRVTHTVDAPQSHPPVNRTATCQCNASDASTGALGRLDWTQYDFAMSRAFAFSDGHAVPIDWSIQL